LRPVIIILWLEDVDVDVDAEDLRAQANASMPASYNANYIY